jgi:Neuraminidase (sialidase)
MAIAPATPGNPRNSESDIVQLTDGALLLGWTEFYAGVGDDHGAARIVGRLSTDLGRTWDAPYTLVENDGGCNVMEVNFLRLRCGRLALLHCQKNVEVGSAGTPDCRVMLRRSPDEGRSFSPAQQLTNGQRYVETASGRGLMLANGRILVECDALESAFCLFSDDDGASWREGTHVRPAQGGCWEPAAVELRDGRVLMFLRTTLGGQYQTISVDGGETWSEPVASALTGSGSPLSIERIPATGDLLAIWNHDVGSARARNPLTAAISRDDGRSWERCRDVASATDDAFAYPSVTFVGETALLTYFDYKDGISLFLQRIPVAWFYG